jgi:anti-sigma factor RsiW
VSVDAVKGFQVARWTANGMAHSVVSDVNAAEMDAFVRALRRAEGAR